MKKTTVCVMDTTVTKINNLKIHPRQSSEDVINYLIEFYLDNHTSHEFNKYSLKQNEVNKSGE